VRLFLEGRRHDLAAELLAHQQQAAEEMRFEQAAVLRDAIATLEEMEPRQKMAAAEGEDTNLRLLRRAAVGGRERVPPAQRRIVDRREFFGRQMQFPAGRIRGGAVEAVLPDQQYVPAAYTCRWDFEDRELLEKSALGKARAQVEFHTPQRDRRSATGGWRKPMRSTCSSSASG